MRLTLFTLTQFHRLLNRFNDIHAHPGRDQGLNESSGREVSQFLNSDERPGIYVNDIARPKLEIQALANQDGMGIDGDGLRAVDGATDNDDPGFVGAIGVTPSRSDRGHDSRIGVKGDRAGQTHLTNYIDFLRGGGWKIKVIVWFNSYVLTKVAVLKKLFEIQIDPLTTASQKAVLEVCDVDDVSIDKPVFQAVRPGDGLEDSDGSIERVNALGHYLAEHIILFGPERDWSYQSAWRAAELAKRLIHFLPEFIDGEPGSEHIISLEIADVTIGPDSHFSAGQFRVIEKPKIKNVAGTEGQVSLPFRALRRIDDGERSIGIMRGGLRG
jgi:hypothetical protein